MSRTLSSAERNYSKTEKECLAIVWAVRTLRPYLERERFTVNTDHHSLRWLTNLVYASGRLVRWRLSHAEYDFDVRYVRGIKNCFADTLSRIPSTVGTTVSIDEEIPCYAVMDFDDDTQHQEETYEPTDVETTADCYALDLPASLVAVTREDFSREQHSDPFCKEVTSRLEKGEESAELRQSRFFVNRKGLVCGKGHLDGVE